MGPTATGTIDDAERDEREANDYFEWLTTDPGPARHMLRSPLRALRASVRLRRLPVVDIPLSDSDEGCELQQALHRSLFSRVTMAGATAVVTLPDDPAAFSQGAHMQTLRRKVRAAIKAGVHWRSVDDREERLELLRLADDGERANVRAAYRNEVPVLDGLERVDLWLVAYSAADEPLLLSITPVDGQWALLRYFRTFSPSDEASLARYWMTQVLAEHLIEQGVRYLADSLSPIRITAGLRHFQRMVGFRLVRTRVRASVAVRREDDPRRSVASTAR